MSSILVVALNPSIDVEWRVPRVRWEEKNSILSERRWAGGKGVNVARWLQQLGLKPRLLLPAGGRNGSELIQGLRTARLPTRVVRLREETRANIIVSTKDRRQLRFNPAGPKLSQREWRDFISAFVAEIKGADLAIFSGSLPSGVPENAYRELIVRAEAAGVRSILDCDGPAFAKGARARPFLVKPNVHELEAWFGKSLRSKQRVIEAANALSAITGNWVLVSRGAEGALLLNSRGNQFFEAPALSAKVLNTVGAGDAMLAGAAYAIQSGASPVNWLEWGLACGNFAVRNPAGVLAGAALIRKLARKNR